MKSIAGIIVIVLVIGAGLYFLNPGPEDFTAFFQARAVSESKSNSSGVFSSIAGGVAKGLAGAAAATLYKYDNHVFYSTFTLGPASKPSERYLGIAKLFIKIK